MREWEQPTYNKHRHKTQKRIKEDEYCRNFIEKLLQDEEFMKRIKKILGKQEGNRVINIDDILRWIKLTTVINSIKYVDIEDAEAVKGDAAAVKVMNRNPNQKIVVSTEHELKTLREIVDHVKSDIPLS
jgi:hypothetical protein